MALFSEAFIHEIGQLVRQHHQKLAQLLGDAPIQTHQAELGAHSPLRNDLELLMRIANGEMQRSIATHAMQQQIEEALQRLIELLFGNLMQSYVSIPDDFWQTDAGILVSRVRWWLSGDELITISNAAALAFGANTQANRMRIARAMDKGLLTWIPDPSVANPQQNRRVLRPQVERLRAQSTLPE